GELGLHDRSWYNRAGVERVMGFASPQEVESFLEAVPSFERQLVQDGTLLVKFYLDISRDEQAERLRKRREDPLKRWKIGPIDAAALEKWDDYSEARDAMLARTHHADGPWTVVRADEKQAARLEVIRHLLSLVDYGSEHADRLTLDPAVLGTWSPERQAVGWLAR
ncbi:MAG: polyphosphate kinase 2, partial [Planctomycetota bacterium]|nr:polyphosphate kinase 2 [Planctomycetota bacterium]